MKKLALITIVLGGLGYLGLCASLYVFQDSFLYFPKDRALKGEQNTYLLPSDVGNTVVTTAIRGEEKAVIYFGGNGEDVSLSLNKFKESFPGHSIYLMHYRGYGGSNGSPNEIGIYDDAVNLYEHVKIGHSKIALMGRSLGSGIATRLASEKEVSQLILITPYSSIEDLAAERFWGVPVSLLLKDKYLSWRYAEAVTATTTIFVAGRDQVIPITNTKKLIENFKQGLVKVYEFRNADHNSISESKKYYALLTELTK